MKQGFVLAHQPIYISFILNIFDLGIFHLLKAMRVEDILPSSLPWGCVTENTPVRGSVTPFPVVIYRGFLPINLYSSPERQNSIPTSRHKEYVDAYLQFQLKNTSDIGSFRISIFLSHWGNSRASMIYGLSYGKARGPTKAIPTLFLSMTWIG